MLARTTTISYDSHIYSEPSLESREGFTTYQHLANDMDLTQGFPDATRSAAKTSPDRQVESWWICHSELIVQEVGGIRGDVASSSGHAVCFFFFFFFSKMMPVSLSLSPDFPSLSTTIILLATTFLVYITTKILYRLFFHPLSHFPGPKLAAATFIYEAYYDVFVPPGGQFATHLTSLHAQYGPIVRCSPDEIHIQDSGFFDTFVGLGPGHARDKWARSNRANGSPGSLASATGHELHRMRRQALNPFFSKRTVTELEASIREKTLKLCAAISSCASQDKIFELGTAFTALTLDVITEYCYDKCQNCLHEEGFAPRWKALMMQLFESTPVAKHFPIVAKILSSLPRWSVKILNPAFVPFFEAQDLIASQAREIWMAERGKKEGRDGDEERPKTIFHGILASALPEKEKSMQRMADEAFVLIVAGGETTARVATVIMAHLLQSPELYARLRAAIEPVVSSGVDLPPSRLLEEIPLIKAVVQEGLRIAAPVSNRPMLIAPDEDLKYGQWIIPRGTPMSMSLQSVLFDPQIFPSPHNFEPDRWIRAAEKGERLDRYLVTFSKGSRMCIGTNLAYAELYLAVAALVARFDFELEDFNFGRDLEVVRDNFVGMPRKDSRGVRVKVRAAVGG